MGPRDHDRSFPDGLHSLHHGLGAVIRADEIHIDHVVQTVHRHVLDFAESCETGAIDEHINWPHSLLEIGQCLIDILVVGADVQRQALHRLFVFVRAGILYLFAGELQLVYIPRDYGHVRSVFGSNDRYLFPDTAGTASHLKVISRISLLDLSFRHRSLIHRSLRRGVLDALLNFLLLLPFPLYLPLDVLSISSYLRLFPFLPFVTFSSHFLLFFLFYFYVCSVFF